MRGTVALSWSGRLDQFGYDLDGTIARETAPAAGSDRVKAAYDRLAQAGYREVDVILNRGHALLSLGRPRDATQEFQQATATAPENALGWLGLGLARYMVDDFLGAEQAFRRSGELDPHNPATAVNLAMALDEQGKHPEALAIWRRLLDSSISAADKKKIERLLQTQNSPAKP